MRRRGRKGVRLCPRGWRLTLPATDTRPAPGHSRILRALPPIEGGDDALPAHRLDGVSS